MKPTRHINGAAVRTHRTQHRLTIQELANKAGVSRIHLNNVELRNYPVSAEVLTQLARVLGTTEDNLSYEAPAHTHCPTCRCTAHAETVPA